ncbi:hypothetical protein HY407_00865 [Candidatus Gottesmanbacteria bacterium]|nr:hypothetical protein [Candidatus Gottesmanbacteria bacterium]
MVKTGADAIVRLMREFFNLDLDQFFEKRRRSKIASLASKCQRWDYTQAKPQETAQFLYHTLPQARKLLAPIKPYPMPSILLPDGLSQYYVEIGVEEVHLYFGEGESFFSSCRSRFTILNPKRNIHFDLDTNHRDYPVYVSAAAGRRGLDYVSQLNKQKPQDILKIMGKTIEAAAIFEFNRQK